MSRLLREPLVHFLLIGAALFGVYALTPNARTGDTSSTEIRLAVDELTQLALTFQAQWRREPTLEEFKRLVERKVETEILYREAMAMGLDKGDEIVKRRMAQKMQFIAEDVAAARTPDATELRRWFEQDSARFAEPARVSFRHLYFSPDRRGVRAGDDADKALAQLAGAPQDARLAASIADPFMFQDYYRERASEHLAKEFGPRFAHAVVKLAPGSWQGPIESGYGWHLVFVDAVIPGRVPAFEEIESDVNRAWLDEQKSKAWEKAYKDLRAKYTVVQAGSVGGTLASGVMPPPATKALASTSGTTK